jgi:threonine aldolase
MVKDAINNPEDIHKPISRLVSLENTVNKGGGCCYEIADIEQIKTVCLSNNLGLHLDGARLFNALVYKQQKASDYGQLFDTISICFSKGLGTPVGSVLLGSSAFIKKSRRIRKVFGGGMRQAGILAAAGIYALENNINRLSEDHLHATQIAAALAATDFVGNILPVETNIVIATITGRFTPATFIEAMAKHNIKLFSVSSTQIRLVVHLNISKQMVDDTIKVIKSL